MKIVKICNLRLY